MNKSVLRVDSRYLSIIRWQLWKWYSREQALVGLSALVPRVLRHVSGVRVVVRVVRGGVVRGRRGLHVPRDDGRRAGHAVGRLRGHVADGRRRRRRRLRRLLVAHVRQVGAGAVLAARRRSSSSWHKQANTCREAEMAITLESLLVNKSFFGACKGTPTLAEEQGKKRAASHLWWAEDWWIRPWLPACGAGSRCPEARVVAPRRPRRLHCWAASPPAAQPSSSSCICFAYSGTKSSPATRRKNKARWGFPISEMDASCLPTKDSGPSLWIQHTTRVLRLHCRWSHIWARHCWSKMTPNHTTIVSERVHKYIIL